MMCWILACCCLLSVWRIGTWSLLYTCPGIVGAGWYAARTGYHLPATLFFARRCLASYPLHSRSTRARNVSEPVICCPCCCFLWCPCSSADKSAISRVAVWNLIESFSQNSRFGCTAGIFVSRSYLIWYWRRILKTSRSRFYLGTRFRDISILYSFHPPPRS